MGIFDSAKRFSDSFFDRLKSNAVDRAIKNAPPRPPKTPPLVKKMDDLDRAAREIEKMIKELE